MFGVDSLAVSGPATLANVTSGAYLGAAPVFWGRYFHAPGQINSSGQPDSMYSAAENSFLGQNNIGLLPIARQTGHVGGGAEAGAADAELNVDAILAELPPAALAAANPNVLVYLDVESNNPLSAAYYDGWANRLVAYSASASGGQVALAPALYSSPLTGQTWTALRTAMAAGAPCAGLWVARYPYAGFRSLTWDAAEVTPPGGAPAALLAWQFWECAPGAPADLNFDVSVVNPAESAAFLAGLARPPA